MNKKLKILSVILAVTLLTPSGIYADSSSDAVQDTEQLETIEDIYLHMTELLLSRSMAISALYPARLS